MIVVVVILLDIIAVAVAIARQSISACLKVGVRRFESFSFGLHFDQYHAQFLPANYLRGIGPFHARNLDQGVQRI